MQQIDEARLESDVVYRTDPFPYKNVDGMSDRPIADRSAPQEFDGSPDRSANEVGREGGK